MRTGYYDYMKIKPICIRCGYELHGRAICFLTNSDCDCPQFLIPIIRYRLGKEIYKEIYFDQEGQITRMVKDKVPE